MHVLAVGSPNLGVAMSIAIFGHGWGDNFRDTRLREEISLGRKF